VTAATTATPRAALGEFGARDRVASPLRGEGDPGGNVVLDRQIVALEREAHALFRKPVGFSVGVRHHRPTRYVG